MPDPGIGGDVDCIQFLPNTLHARTRFREFGAATCRISKAAQGLRAPMEISYHLSLLGGESNSETPFWRCAPCKAAGQM
jgi:hypothetical protein